MSNPITNSPSLGAAALGPVQSVKAADFAEFNNGPTSGVAKPNKLITLDPDTQSRIVQTAFVGLQDNPELLNMTPNAAARMLKGVPPEAFKKAIAALGVKTDGNLTLGQILKSVPPETGKKILATWFKELAPGQQAVLVGVAAGVILASKGLAGLKDLGLKATLVKGSSGNIAVALVPDSSKKSLAGQVSGELTIPIGRPGNQVKLEGKFSTEGTALFKAGMDLALNSDSKLNLGVATTNTGVSGTVGYSNGSFTLKLGMTEKQQFGVQAGVNLTPNVRVEGFHDPDKGTGAQVSGQWQLR